MSTKIYDSKVSFASLLEYSIVEFAHLPPGRTGHYWVHEITNEVVKVSVHYIAIAEDPTRFGVDVSKKDLQGMISRGHSLMVNLLAFKAGWFRFINDYNWLYFEGIKSQAAYDSILELCSEAYARLYSDSPEVAERAGVTISWGRLEVNGTVTSAEAEAHKLGEFLGTTVRESITNPINEASYLDQLIKEFGRTDNPHLGGWILPEGDFLDLSGGSGMRADDHRIINGVLRGKGSDRFDSRYTAMMYLAKNNRMIRWMPETWSAELATKPTPAQIMTLRGLAEEGQRLTIEGPGNFYEEYDEDTADLIGDDLRKKFGESKSSFSNLLESVSEIQLSNGWVVYPVDSLDLGLGRNHLTLEQGATSTQYKIAIVPLGYPGTRAGVAIAISPDSVGNEKPGPFVMRSLFPALHQFFPKIKTFLWSRGGSGAYLAHTGNLKNVEHTFESLLVSL
jgi:hypothetical protein